MTYIPEWHPQNPALSGDRYGWLNCTAYSAAGAGAFHSQGRVVLTGAQVRAQSNEPLPVPSSPGLNLAQIDNVLLRHGVDLDVRYRYLVHNNPDGSRMVTGNEPHRTRGFSVKVSAPRRISTPTGSVSLVKITKPGSVYDGWWISSAWAREV